MWAEQDGLWAWREQCGNVCITDADGPVQCVRVKKHLGAHHGRGFWWSMQWEGATFVPGATTFVNQPRVTWEVR